MSVQARASELLGAALPKDRWWASVDTRLRLSLRNPVLEGVDRSAWSACVRGLEFWVVLQHERIFSFSRSGHCGSCAFPGEGQCGFSLPPCRGLWHKGQDKTCKRSTKGGRMVKTVAFAGVRSWHHRIRERSKRSWRCEGLAKNLSTH